MDIISDKLHDAWEFYEWCLTRADKRVENWFLMDRYSTTWILTGLYLLIVLQGKKLMRNRPAFEFPRVLCVYNLGLVVLNFHIFYELLTCSLRLNYNYSCQPVDYSDNPDEVRIAKALWWYYFSKCIEFMDTIFFVLRKKNGQISFLHLYHHATMFPIWWIGVKFVPGGQSFFGAMINSFIHVVMYTYYGISALGPQYQKYLWWKKYLTRLQLFQFFIGMAYSVQSIVFGCRAAPIFMSWFWLLYGLSLIALFLNFYIRAYVLPSKKAKADSSALSSTSTATRAATAKTRSSRKAESNGHVEANGHVANGHTKKVQ